MGLTAAIYRQSDMGAGLNTRTAKHLIHASEALAFNNLTLSADRGMPKRRNGYTKLNAGAIPTASGSPINGLYRYYKSDGTRKLLVSHYGRIYRASGSTINAEVLVSGLTLNEPVNFCTLGDICLSTNGIEGVKRYNGTAMRSAGFPAPGAATATASSAAGLLIGDYYWKVTFIYDDAAEESTMGTASGLVTVTDKKVQLTSIPTGSAGSGVTKRNIYRTQAGGSTYYLIATIADNTTTTYLDNTADVALISLGPTDNGIPPTTRFLAAFANRMWYARNPTYKSRLYFTAITQSETSPNTTGVAPTHGADIEIVPSDFWVDINKDDGDEITGLAVTLDSLIIFKSRSIWRLIGDNPENFTIMKVNADSGCIAPRSIARVETLVYFLSGGDKPSIYATDGVRVIPIGERIQTTLATDIDLSYISTATAVRYKYNYVLIYRPTGGGYNSKGFIYDYIKDAWATIGNIHYASVFSVWDGAGDQGECYFGDASGGNVHRFDNGTSDNGTEISSTWQSKFYDFGQPDTRKPIAQVVMLVKAGGNNITAEIRRDFNTSPISGESSTFTPTADPSDGGVAKIIFEPAETCQAHYLSLSVTSSGTGDFEIYSVAIYYKEQEDAS